MHISIRIYLEVVRERLISHARLTKGVDARGGDGVVGVQVRGGQHGQGPAQGVALVVFGFVRRAGERLK